MSNNHKIRILVLDDEASIRESLSDFLEDFGFDVRAADTGEAALSALDNFVADVAIVDMRLPGMDGNAFITQANKRNPNTRFIIHTGSVNYHLTQDLRAIGVTPEFMFLKPIGNLSTFIEAINKLTAS